MLRNWVTQFGYASGRWAGDEGVSEEDRRKFIGQIGNYFGWNPPTMMNWMVEVAKDDNGKYVMVFMRYATDDEAEKMLGKNGLGVIRKAFGVVLLAIAVKLFASNVKGLFV